MHARRAAPASPRVLTSRLDCVWMGLVNSGSLKPALLGVFLAVSATRCSVYDESLLENSAPSTECVLARWPQPPAGTNLGGNTSFVVALRSFDFGEEYQSFEGPVVPARNEVGYDMDRRCTANDALDDPRLTDANSCDPVASWFRPRFGDFTGGRDNGLRYLIELIAGALQDFGTPIYNVAIESGEVSLLMQIEGYNEQPDDDDVGFKLFIPGPFSMANPDVPQFEGRDEWPIAKDSFELGDSNVPKFVARRAYVSGNTLVANFQTADLRLRLGIAESQIVDIILRFTDPFFTAKIEKLGEVWRLKDGQIAARWPTAELLKQVKFFPNPFYDPTSLEAANTLNMCTSTPTYRVVRDAICGSTDIVAGAFAPGAICDSISVGIAFEAIQARLGGTVQLEDSITDCGDFDPALDSCAKTYEQLVEDGLAPPPAAP